MMQTPSLRAPIHMLAPEHWRAGRQRIPCADGSYSHAGLPTFIRRRTDSGILSRKHYNATYVFDPFGNFLRGSFVDCVPEAFLCPPKALQGRSGESADVFHHHSISCRFFKPQECSECETISSFPETLEP